MAGIAEGNERVVGVFLQFSADRTLALGGQHRACVELANLEQLARAFPPNPRLTNRVQNARKNCVHTSCYNLAGLPTTERETENEGEGCTTCTAPSFSLSLSTYHQEKSREEKRRRIKILRDRQESRYTESACVPPFPVPSLVPSQHLPNTKANQPQPTSTHQTLRNMSRIDTMSNEPARKTNHQHPERPAFAAWG